MAEEHGVGDGPEERGPDHDPGHRQRVRAAGVDTRRDQADDADEGRR